MTHRPSIRWFVALGFALGGFFDGILLHQILQWHHVLSLVRGVETMRGQVLWDGYFHALMYLLGSVTLWGLWRARADVQRQPGLRLSGALLAGFGAWHVIDGILSHWVLAIHRVRLDTEYPLLWDLAWFVLFGLVPLAAGWILMRKSGSPINYRSNSFLVIPLLGLMTASMAAWSLRPGPDQELTTIVFAPGVRPADAMNAVVVNGGRLVWTDQMASVVS